jgi:hypothetical protein
MTLQDKTFDQRPEVKFVSKESFREEIDLLKNNVKFLKSQALNKRKWLVSLIILFCLSVIGFGVLSFFLYHIQVRHKLDMVDL